MLSGCMRCGRELKDPWSAREGIGPVCKRKREAEARAAGRDVCNYSMIGSDVDSVTIQDLGPWDKYMTVTNAAAQVVEELREMLNGRRLFYIDSEGNRDEILHVNGKFHGFAAIDSYKPDLDKAPEEEGGLTEEEEEDIWDELSKDYDRMISQSLKQR